MLMNARLYRSRVRPCSARKRRLRRQIRALRCQHKTKSTLRASLILLAMETQDSKDGVCEKGECEVESGSLLSPLTPRGRVAALVPSNSPTSSDYEVRSSVRMCASDVECGEVRTAEETLLPKTVQYWERTDSDNTTQETKGELGSTSLAVAGSSRAGLSEARDSFKIPRQEDPVWAYFNQSLANGIYMGPHCMASEEALDRLFQADKSREDILSLDCLSDFQRFLFPTGSADVALVAYERTLEQLTSCARPAQASRPSLIVEEIIEEPAPEDFQSEPITHPEPQEMQRGQLSSSSLIQTPPFLHRCDPYRSESSNSNRERFPSVLLQLPMQ